MTDHEHRIVLSTMRIAASVMTAGGAITTRFSQAYRTTNC